LRALYDRLETGGEIAPGDIAGELRLLSSGRRGDALEIRTRRALIRPRTPGQAGYVEALLSHDLVFGLGPAGTGKTYLAVAIAVSKMLQGKVKRIILSRPAVEAGEKLGFLPGDLKEKVDPYLRPLYDALFDMLPGEQVQRWIDTGEIEIAPLAFMRGRTLSHAYVILDEAQNTTSMQMKMFLTRLGEGSHMAVTGDPSQTDLPGGQQSGLAEVRRILADVEGVAFIELTSADVVRHDLVSRIVDAYDRSEGKNGSRGFRRNAK
jgi:phosphate starvation-inducible PhoH-like protein